MPEVDQVVATLPNSFRDKCTTTYTVTDATQIFLQTLSHLHLQSSTWSNYWSHNNGKILIGYTPNGVISSVSPMYVGSISHVEPTRVCVLLEKLEVDSSSCEKHAILLSEYLQQFQKLGPGVSSPWLLNFQESTWFSTVGWVVYCPIWMPLEMGMSGWHESLLW